MIHAMVPRTSIKRDRKRLLQSIDVEVYDHDTNKCHKDAMGKRKHHNNHHEPDVKKEPSSVINCKHLDIGNIYPRVLWGSARTNIFNCYDLREELGSGGYATTCLCIEKATGKKYACKMIDKKKLVSHQDRKNVRLEIVMMMRLRGHKNIVNLKDTFEDEQKVYLVMELCEGGELFDQMVNICYYEEDHAAAIVKAIIEAVKFCHERGIIHRDLKPENILYTSKEKMATLKIIDFGLSTSFVSGQSFNEVVGTPGYMAPEVLMGKHGQQVDIWSVGVILYILLNGDVPFFGENDQEIVEAVMTKEINFEEEIWNKISMEAKDLLRGMLDRDPQKRLTVQQILEHPWLVKEGPRSTDQAEKDTSRDTGQDEKDTSRKTGQAEKDTSRKTGLAEKPHPWLAKLQCIAS